MIKAFLHLIWTVSYRLLAAAVVVLVLLIAVVLIDHRLQTHLPSPSGKFPVGRMMLRVAVPADQSGSQHEVFAWIWYPAADSTTGKPAVYLPPTWRHALENWDGLPGKLFSRDLTRVRTHSYEGVGVRAAGAPWPIVLFRGGLSALGPEYTALTEEWASRGFVVVAIDAPGRSLVYVQNDGRVVTRSPENDADAAETVETLQRMLPRLATSWAADSAAVLDRLAALSENLNSPWFGRLDATRVAMVGHSLGGAVALQFCRNDQRCKAAIDIDGLVTPEVAREGVRGPTLMLMGEHPAHELDDPVNRQISVDLLSAIVRSAPGSITRESMPEANHFNFSDGALTKSHVLMNMLRLFRIVHMDPKDQLVRTADRCGRFLEQHLQ